MTLHSCLYRGNVMHRRRRPRQHRLNYAVFSLLLDLDELPLLGRQLRLFAYNKPGLVSFHDRDHGPATGGALRPWVEAHMRDAGVGPDGGAIRLLCYPRILGYVFNPLSVYFCYRRDGALCAILYEVCNTYGERHTYAMPTVAGGGRVIRQRCRKALYVSPFIAMAATYDFRISPPDSTVGITIHESDDDGPLLTASFVGTREPLTLRTLAGALLRFPLLTAKVIAAIHWEALRLWLKGTPVFAHHAAPAPIAGNAAHGDKA